MGLTGPKEMEWAKSWPKRLKNKLSKMPQDAIDNAGSLVDDNLEVQIDVMLANEKRAYIQDQVGII